MKNPSIHLFALIYLLAMAACTSTGMIFKADPAPPSGFIENPHKMAEMRTHAPFNAIWFKDKELFDRTRSKYKKIYFAPVSTDYVEKKGWWTSLNTVDSEQYCSDVKEMATYIQKSFKKAFAEDPHHPQELTEQPDASTIVYKIALVDLIATKVHINAAGAALGAFVPGGGMIRSAAKGSIAIEVKVIDGETNDTIITWADREQDRSSLFSVSDFSFYAHARKAIDDWAQQLVELHNHTTQDLVEDSSPFTLIPY